MYFVRIDFMYKGSSVQRTRNLCSDYAYVCRMLSTLNKFGYTVLAVKVERCC